MAWVETRITRTTQPQDACGVDWTNPITRGLVFAYNPATGVVNLVDGKTATTNNTSRRASPYGVFAKCAASQRNIEWADYQPIKTSDGSGTGDFTIVVFSNPPAISATTQYLFAQKNDAGGSPFSQVQIAAHLNFSSGTYEQGTLTFAIYDPAGNQIAQNSGSMDGLWHMWSGVRSGTTMTLCRDAKVLSSTTSTVRSILQGTPRYLALGGQGNTTASALAEGIGCSFAFNRALSDAEIKSLSDNPWQLFESEVQRIWVDSAASVSLPTLVQPNATTSAGAWTATGAASLHAAINEAVASAAEYISVNSASTTELVLAESAHPGAANQTLAYRASSTQGSTLTVTLTQGVTTIMTRTHALTGVDTLYTQTLTAPEIALITAGAISVTLTTS